MYDYNKLSYELSKIDSKNASVFSIGKSAMEKDIYCIRIGHGEKVIIMNGAHHGLEYITSAFLMRFAFEYIRSADTHCPYHDIFPSELLDKISVYIIPMVNPDGVDIAINGVSITNPYHRELISKVGIHSFSRVWQANANGVDLNHNYNAGWKITASSPAPSKYAGEAPEDQPESRAMASFIRHTNCDMLLCFHSQGREIYYDYEGILGEYAENIAKKMQLESGYTPAMPEGSAAYGGCKDWFIKEFGRCGFTIEIGSGKNPLPASQLNRIYSEASGIILVAIKELMQQDS